MAEHGFSPKPFTTKYSSSLSMTKRKAGLAFVFAWFAFGGMGHFVAPDFFARIIPPELPLHREAVYISGVFELLGAAGLLFSTTRRAAGIGLFILTIAVTPANIYMWRNPQLFPQTPEILLSLRLVIQVFLLAIIWWSTQVKHAKPNTYEATN